MASVEELFEEYDEENDSGSDSGGHPSDEERTDWKVLDEAVADLRKPASNVSDSKRSDGEKEEARKIARTKELIREKLGGKDPASEKRIEPKVSTLSETDVNPVTSYTQIRAEVNFDRNGVCLQPLKTRRPPPEGYVFGLVFDSYEQEFCWRPMLAEEVRSYPHGLPDHIRPTVIFSQDGKVHYKDYESKVESRSKAQVRT